ncbi:MAG: ribosome silencing factor [Desulfobacteraceae bacterium]|nr:ribosome silencing factor [Desulfobacteraceae bacterium]
MSAKLDPKLDLCVKAVLERKAEDVLILDVRELTSIADYFIICSGRSSRQVSSMGDHIERYLKKHKHRASCIDGKQEGHWVLMDYGDVIIHIFYDETRRFFDLEGLWSEAKRVTTEKLETYSKSSFQQFSGEEIIIE